MFLTILKITADFANLLPDLQRQTALRPRDSQSAFAPQGSLKQGFNSQLKVFLIFRPFVLTFEFLR